jgi:hypothetical protein
MTPNAEIGIGPVEVAIHSNGNASRHRNPPGSIVHLVAYSACIFVVEKFDCSGLLP